MGKIEDFGQNAKPAGNLLGQAAMPKGAPQAAALLTQPTPGQRIRTAAAAATSANAVGEAASARPNAAPPAGTMSSAARNMSMADLLRERAGASRLPTFTPPAPAPLDLSRPFEQLMSEPTKNPNLGSNAMSKQAADFQRSGAGNPANPGPRVPGAAPAAPPAAVPPAPAPAPPPAAAGASVYQRATQASSEMTRQMMPKVPASLARTGAVVTGAAGKVAPWVGPVIETSRAVRVGLDPESTKIDTATQVAEGVGRTGMAMAGAGAGALALSATGPGAVVGAIGGGLAGYFGADVSITGLRKLFGLETASPYQLTDARIEKNQQQAMATANERAAAARANPSQAPAAAPAQPPAAPATIADAAGAALNPQQTRGVQAGATYPAADPNLMARYHALQKEQSASRIAMIVEGNGQVPQVMLKDGSLIPLPPGQPVPEEVAQFWERGDQLDAMRNGLPVPAARAAAAPAATAPAPIAVDGAPSRAMGANQQLVHDQAVAKGYNPATALMIASIETGRQFNADAKNPKGTASGIFQMTKRSRAAYGSSEAEWATPQVQVANGIDHIMKADAALAAKLGRAPSPAESYMGHLFGASGAGVVLTADPNAPIEKVVASYDPKNAAATVKNNGMTGMTVGQAIAKWTALAANHMDALGLSAGQAAPATAASGDWAAMATSPVGVIEGMDRFVEVPTPGGGYQRVPKTIYDAAMRGGGVAAPGGPMNAYLDGINRNAIYQANPNQAKLDEATVLGEYRLAEQGIAGHAQAEAARINAGRTNGAGAITTLRQGDKIDPETGMPVKQGDLAVYMKDGVPTVIEPPQKKLTVAEAHAQAKQAIALKADKGAINARLTAAGYPPLP
jgi:hypothetical protein